jgi:hypothetical protein
MDKLNRRYKKDWKGMAGEADRRIVDTMPKHLFSGKRT